jgi:hypothetical protein
VWWPCDSGEAAVGMELGGGSVQAWREGEKGAGRTGVRRVKRGGMSPLKSVAIRRGGGGVAKLMGKIMVGSTIRVSPIAQRWVADAQPT